METTEAFAGVDCRACGSRHAADAGRCPDCDAPLDAAYDWDAVDPDALAVERPASMWAFDAALPFRAPVTAEEGGTPLVDAGDLAADLGVDALLLKDESRNPTGTVDDRGMSVAVTAAREAGATDVSLPSAGNSAQSAAAYAGRAGLTAHAFVPSRAPFSNKAMVNVHGGDMRVVGGRYADAVAAFSDRDPDWRSLRAFDGPYRHEGAKTVAYEVASALGWSVPDRVVVPVGTGATLAGVAAGFRDLERVGLLEERPRLVAAQPAGCAPVVEALADGAGDVAPAETPDSIVGELEVPDPPGGRPALEALRSFDGRAVAVDDGDALESAVAVASRATVEVGAAGGVAAAAAWALAEEGSLGADETVVVLNTESGGKTPDVLRSHLMGQGV
jgi:threonine synthase